ncbi:DNA-processing protein DprA [Brotaphodocola sp.]|uniref:DNA-processing protein DprA n=1 Tax=Brotaphodocola sp. TaxID=3073577 RepID=UPI003D7D61E3
MGKEREKENNEKEKNEVEKKKTEVEKNREEKNRNQEREVLYWLSKLVILGAVSIRKIFEHFGSLGVFYEILFEKRFSSACISGIGANNIEEKSTVEAFLEKECPFLSKRQQMAILSHRANYETCKAEFEQLSERGMRFVIWCDEEYPEKLREIYDYPMGLFVRGKLPNSRQPVVAVVGARGCSEYGEQLAERFSMTLAENGVQIVSGLASGIDGASHRGALRAGKPTFGVLGCGVNICYPSENFRIYEEMGRTGGILSEFGPDTPPKAMNFPMRNRIISGMADAIVVVEARAKSGSLITADLGMEQGREIFALPGRVTDHLSEGCNHLIQQGAHLATSPEDVLEFLGVKYRKKLIIHEKNVNGLAKKEKLVYSCLDFKPKHLDQIVAQTGLGISDCMGILLELELGGYVFRSANHYYGKKSDMWENG